MPRQHYSEVFKTINVGDNLIIVYVVDDLCDDELIKFYRIAIEQEHFEHAEAIQAEAQSRGFTIELKYK